MMGINLGCGNVRAEVFDAMFTKWGYGPRDSEAWMLTVQESVQVEATRCKNGQ